MYIGAEINLADSSTQSSLWPQWLTPLLYVKCTHSLSAAAAAKSLQSCPTLCDPIDGSPPGSSTHGIFQARTLEWGAIAFSNAWKWKVKVKSLSRVQRFTTPWTAAKGSSTHGIFQAKVLESDAIAFSTLPCKTPQNLTLLQNQMQSPGSHRWGSLDVLLLFWEPGN